MSGQYMKRSILNLLLIMLTLALAVAGCGTQQKEEPRPEPVNPAPTGGSPAPSGSPAQPPASPAPEPPVATPSPPSGAPTEPAPPGAAAPPVAAPAPGGGAAAVATQESDVAGVEAAILEVKRAGADTVTVRWQYRNKTAEQKELIKSLTYIVNTWEYGLAAEAYLVDPVNRKKYLVVKDAQGFPLAAKVEPTSYSLMLAANQTLTTWAKFPAPPENVLKISVYVPRVPPFEDVPISK